MTESDRDLGNYREGSSAGEPPTVLTEDALRAHCDGLDDVTPRADAEVKEDSKLALLLRAAHPR
jgi:hypothetical protein